MVDTGPMGYAVYRDHAYAKLRAPVYKKCRLDLNPSDTRWKFVNRLRGLLRTSLAYCLMPASRTRRRLRTTRTLPERGHVTHMFPCNSSPSPSAPINRTTSYESLVVFASSSPSLQAPRLSHHHHPLGLQRHCFVFTTTLMLYESQSQTWAEPGRGGRNLAQARRPTMGVCRTMRSS